MLISDWITDVGSFDLRGHRNHTRGTVLAKEQRLRPAHDLDAAEVEEAQHGDAPGRGLNAVDRPRDGLFEAELRRGRTDAAERQRTYAVDLVFADDHIGDEGADIGPIRGRREGRSVGREMDNT